VQLGLLLSDLIKPNLLYNLTRYFYLLVQRHVERLSSELCGILLMNSLYKALE